MDVVVIELRRGSLFGRLYEVFAQVFKSEEVKDVTEILLEVLVTKDCAQEEPEAFDDVVFEPVSVKYRNDVIRIRHEARCGDLFKVVFDGRPLVGEDQPWSVQAVTAEHASDRIGDEVNDRRLCEEEVTFFGCFVRPAEGGIVRERYSFKRYMGRYFVLKSVKSGDGLVVLNFEPTLFEGALLPFFAMLGNDLFESLH